MGWSSSIHVAADNIDQIIASLNSVGEHNCFVGVSGDGWVGVYSQKCEETGGVGVPKLASKLSAGLENPVLGVILYEDDLGFWLFRRGKLVDKHPLGRIRRFLVRKREISNLAIDDQAGQRMEAALETKQRLRPHERMGVTEAEFIAKTNRDLARVQKMSPEEREQMMREYSQYRSMHLDDLRTLCEGVGIREYDWNYSDLAGLERFDEESRPPTTMGLTHLE